MRFPAPHQLFYRGADWQAGAFGEFAPRVVARIRGSGEDGVGCGGEHRQYHARGIAQPDDAKAQGAREGYCHLAEIIYDVIYMPKS